MAFINELKRDFRQLVDKGKLSHGYLFFGESLKSQADFAVSLANLLENQEWRAPEKVLVDAMVLEKDEIGIDEARDIAKFLWQKPVKSSKRTLIVNRAQGLTAHAQNAILKIAEEPPEHGFLILITRNFESLLSPLVSRLQKIYFSGSGDFVVSEAAAKYASQLLRAPGARERSETIKQILETEADLSEIVAGLLQILRKDLNRNWPVIKDVLKRWSLVNQFNVNKKLQLEAALGRIS